MCVVPVVQETWIGQIDRIAEPSYARCQSRCKGKRRFNPRSRFEKSAPVAGPNDALQKGKDLISAAWQAEAGVWLGLGRRFGPPPPGLPRRAIGGLKHGLVRWLKLFLKMFYDDDGHSRSHLALPILNDCFTILAGASQDDLLGVSWTFGLS
jgi:hypothetical protein